MADHHCDCSFVPRQKDVLIERLKTLRTTPEALEEHGRLPRSYAAEEEHSTAHESFAIIEHDDQVIEGESKSEAASAAAPAGSATTTATARVSESNASVRTDEFGALQLGEFGFLLVVLRCLRHLQRYTVLRLL